MDAIDNNEYLAIISDTDNRILWGIDKNGEVHIRGLFTEKICNGAFFEMEATVNVLKEKVALLDEFMRNTLTYATNVVDHLLCNVNNYQTADYEHASTQNTNFLYKVKKMDYVGNCSGERTASFLLYSTKRNNVIFQYVGYYDSFHQLCVAMRQGTEDSGAISWNAWEKVHLGSFVGYDGHNYIHLIVDDDGRLHVSANMHATPLNYWRFQRDYDLGNFVKTSMTGTNDLLVTYPHFFFIPPVATSRKLAFTWRDGISGCGDQLISFWEDSKWSNPVTLFSRTPNGTQQYSAYCLGFIGDFKAPIYNSYKNCFELFFLWRSSIYENDCSQLSYVRTDDFQTFTAYNGIQVTLPIQYDSANNPCTNPAIIDNVVINGGLLNSKWWMLQTSSYGTLLVYHKYEQINQNVTISSLYAIVIYKDLNSKYSPCRILELSTSPTDVKTDTAGLNVSLIQDDGTNYIKVFADKQSQHWACRVGITVGNPCQLTVSSLDYNQKTFDYPECLATLCENTSSGVEPCHQWGNTDCDNLKNRFMLYYEQSDHDTGQPLPGRIYVAEVEPNDNNPA